MRLRYTWVLVGFLIGTGLSVVISPAVVIVGALAALGAGAAVRAVQR